MAIRIGSNIESLKVQRYLGDATQSQAKSFEKLSSGLRINRASDDAAGLAIASSLSAKNRIYLQGVRNVNDGISSQNIADGAIESLKNIITRAKELAEQSANGVYSDSQRSALDKEFQSLGSEYNRILDSTSFNGQVLFSTSNSSLVIQAGDSAVALATGTSSTQSTDLTQRVSVSPTGQENSGSAGTRPAGEISADGRYVLFQSNDSNLVSGDTNGAIDIFVRDLETGTTTKVTQGVGGVQANGSSDIATISADGRFVVYSSSASNLVAGDTNGTNDVFRTDLQTGTTIKISAGTGGAAANGGSYRPVISDDGRYVSYDSAASNLVAGDSNGALDVFRTDTLTGTTIRLSTASGGTQGNADASRPSISGDGRYVVFESGATNFVAGDTNGSVDIFVNDTLTATTTRVSKSSAGVQTNSDSYGGIISGEGRYVVYQSFANNLTSGDSNGSFDIFRTDIQTGTTILVSTASDGTQGNNYSYSASISRDGRYVAYTSDATNLVSGDTNSAADIFLTDTLTAATSRVGLSQSGRQGTSSAGGAGNTSASISADGQYISFSSDFYNILDGTPGTTGADVYLAHNPQSSSTGLKKFQWADLRSQQQALNSLTWLDAYSSELATASSNIGSNTARLSIAAAQLSSASLGYQTASSRIMDVDIASEAANSTRSEILQKASAAVLSQANLQPSIALKLLKN